MKVKVIDPKPIFTGRTEKKKPVFYFPSAEKAEEWHKQSPATHHLKAATTPTDLDATTREKPLRVHTRRATYQDFIDPDIPEWETE